MNVLNKYEIYVLSEGAAIISFGNAISEELNDHVLSISRWLRQHPFTGMKDLVEAYTSLTVLFDPFVVQQGRQLSSTVFEWVKQRLEEACRQTEAITVSPGKDVTIPVCYHPSLGPDLKLVAAAKNISVEELVHIHSACSYRVYMLGFLPGFAYMGRLDARLVMPRRSQPRQEVEAGSVGIAGWQTGIYPLNAPGGWQIIGRTPLAMFNAMNEQPALLAAGDTVRFHPIGLEDFHAFKF